MPVVRKFRYRCTTEAADITEWREDVAAAADPPTVCINNAAHTIDLASLVQIDIAGSGLTKDVNGHLVTAFDGGATQIGMQAVQVLNTPDISSDYIRSWQITATSLVTEILDIFIGDDLVGATGKCYLSGGEYRCRTSAAEGSSLNFAMVDRNDTLGLFSTYGMNTTKLTALVFNTGVITDVVVGDYAVGGTSSAVSKVLAVGTDFLGIEFHDALFQDGENITFTRAGSPVATLDCTLGTWVEGDVIVIQESLKDEWIEGFDVREIQPGGSKEVPQGLYYRVKLYNADVTNNLRVKVSLTVGRL